MQRIIAGRLGGRRLLALPTKAPVRPTGERVREAIFSALHDRVIDARVLDLFAGSGALAIEALSRGAAHAVVVDRDPSIVRHLTAQFDALALSAQVTIVHAEAREFLATSGRGAPFDLVFLDPPYDDGTSTCAACLAALADPPWLADDADVVVERARIRGSAPPLAVPRALTVRASRDYGQTTVDFLRGPARPR
ncbi:MAG: 16S rRNA (guanine(966)-N(2))-methyltransferase RsmD [Nannocystaceae bacterium]